MRHLDPVEYWSCGKDFKGHFHIEYRFAQRCIDRQKTHKLRPDAKTLVKRNLAMLDLWLTTGKTVVPDGIKRLQATSILKEYASNAAYILAETKPLYRTEITKDLAEKIKSAADLYPKQPASKQFLRYFRLYSHLEKTGKWDWSLLRK